MVQFLTDVGCLLWGDSGRKTKKRSEVQQKKRTKNLQNIIINNTVQISSKIFSVEEYIKTDVEQTG
jgi:hypothetical protein